MNMTTLAHEILDMEDEIIRLRKENERLKWFETEYHVLMRDSIQHSQKMMANTMKLIMTPGVGEALAKNTETFERLG